MKGEHGSESKNDTNINNMFGAKLHQQRNAHHFQSFNPPLHHHHFQQTSDEENTSCSSGGGGAISTALTTFTTRQQPQQQQQQHGDGATIEVIRRPRGRPPGSKNKPKPPIIISREPEPSMSPYILESPVGADVIDTINRFTRRRNIGLCILSGSGTVANVTLRQPTNNTPPVTFHGRYDILSLTATFQVQSSSSSSLAAAANHIAISLAGPQGQIFGGAVAGPLIAAGTVFMIAASFNHPSYHRLSNDEEEVVHHSVTGSGFDNNYSSPPPPSSGDGGDQMISLFSRYLPSDVLWAPTPTRQSQPPSY